MRAAHYMLRQIAESTELHSLIIVYEGHLMSQKLS